MKLQTVTFDALTIRDERAFRHIGLYDTLKQMLLDDGVQVRVPAAGSAAASWERVVFLNLTFWSAATAGDVLVDDSIDADVLAHIAWHHAAQKAIPAGLADAHLLGEAIASAFDLYLIGRTLGRKPKSGFLATQVPAMSEVATAAGLDEEGFGALLMAVADEPERAFEDLRALLFDVTTALVRCVDIDAAVGVMSRFEHHRFAPLLHHYQLSNWVLYARALGSQALEPDLLARSVDHALREAPVSLDWLEQRWLPAGD